MICSFNRFRHFSYSLNSYLQVSPHLLIGDPEEGLTGPSVAEAASAHMNVVQTGHSVHLRAKEDFFSFFKYSTALPMHKHAVIKLTEINQIY